MILSLDTETTGLDFVHGAMPFLVTTCDEDGVTRFWEWDVDPLTRRPEVPSEDVVQITELIDAANTIYLHNAKFDARALLTIGVELPWSKVRDTLVASHLLGSNHSHKLKGDKNELGLCERYLGIYIKQFELDIEKVTKACRTIAKREHPDWRLAKEGAAGMPSVKEGSSKREEDKPWKNDMWLPRALYKSRDDHDPSWEDSCSKYANADSEHTILLGLELERIIRERGYWKIYEHRLELPRVAGGMEEYGVTAIGGYTDATIQEYEEHVAEAETILTDIAREYGHSLELAKGASLNDNMRDFFYGAVQQECPRCTYKKRVKYWNGEEEADGEDGYCPKCAKSSKRRSGMKHQLITKRRKNLLLPVIYNSKTGNASLDKDAMQEYLTTLDGNQLDFVRVLADKRGYDTALSYMESYRRFWRPVPGALGYYRIHASFNPCGTDHLRWASNSPNMQNVSKKDDYNLRACFGPLPDREWWSMDFQNIELRIPAYESGEPKMVEIFEKGEVAPYWGSYHNLIASIVYPDEYWPLADVHDGFKKKYKATMYQWIKNFNFAKQYGCGRRKGDRTARKVGAFDLVNTGLPELARLQAYYLDQAEKTGYVQTLPDSSIDSENGYPILASRTEDNRVLSTTPFNYHVSGTACECKNKALVRCEAKCEEWRRAGFDAHIPLEIHDEILFDFPRGKCMKENLERAMVLRGIMAQSGDTLVPRIPTPISVEYHDENWARGVAV